MNEFLVCKKKNRIIKLRLFLIMYLVLLSVTAPIKFLKEWNIGSDISCFPLMFSLTMSIYYSYKNDKIPATTRNVSSLIFIAIVSDILIVYFAFPWILHKYWKLERNIFLLACIKYTLTIIAVFGVYWIVKKQESKRNTSN